MNPFPCPKANRLDATLCPERGKLVGHLSECVAEKVGSPEAQASDWRPIFRPMVTGSSVFQPVNLEELLIERMSRERGPDLAG
ncbi:MAG: hypothetical protein CMJ45_09645 [Planctomyces sp.]|nr:hypothetical protein [Planctomyces sp.]